MALGLQCKDKPLAPDPHLPRQFRTFFSPVLCLPTKVTRAHEPMSAAPLALLTILQPWLGKPSMKRGTRLFLLLLQESPFSS